MGFTSDFIFDLCVWEYGDSGEQLQRVNKSVVVGVPDDKSRLTSPEDVLEFGKVDTEVVTDRFECSEMVTKFRKVDYDRESWYCREASWSSSWSHECE